MGSSGLIVELDVAEEMLEVAKESLERRALNIIRGVRKDIKTAADMTWLLFILLSLILGSDLALQNLISLLIEGGEYPLPTLKAGKPLINGTEEMELLRLYSSSGRRAGSGIKKQGLEITRVIDNQELYLVTGGNRGNSISRISGNGSVHCVPRCPVLFPGKDIRFGNIIYFARTVKIS